ncbi:MAG: flagellar assembly protein T N-terminal domain-containing protein [Myxococcota bacterium]|nr:flagellar assembly protein T N-terminal domain-containing protein [Myxococcota bacterium]
MKALKLTAFALVALVASSALAQENTQVEATGEAAIVNNDRPRALKEAKQNAFRSAVEQAAGVLVSSDTLTANSTLVSDRIYSRSEGYIKKHTLVGQPKEEGGVLSVTIKAEVATKDLDKDLQAVQALINRSGNRKLVIVLNEITATPKGEAVSSAVMAQVLTEGFKKDGWTLIDPQFAAGELNVSAGVTALTNTEVKRVGNLSKAEYILYGKVNYRQQVTEKNSMLSGAYFVTGEYELTVFATDSGDQLATLSGKIDFDPKEKGVSPLLSYERTAFDLTKKRGEKVLADVRASVVKHLSNNEQNGQRVAATVMGMTSYSAVQNFKKVLLAQVTGVREVRPGTFANGKAEFDIVFLGSTDEFAEKIGDKKFQGKVISVTGVTGNTVELTLAR